MAWFQTSDWNEFMAIREEVLLDFLQAIERAGASVAFPTRTITFAADEVSRGFARAPLPVRQNREANGP
jgi:hypothetical protein